MSTARGRARGFTLIELLVVIAIIAILAAIIFPVLTSAKITAKKGKCQAHQKELTAALMMYTEDYGGRLPFIQFLSYTDWNGNAAGQPGVGVTRLYQPYLKNFDIILCPQEYIDDYTHKSLRQAYAYNQCLYAPPATNKWAASGRAEIYYDSNPAHRAGRPMAAVKWPSKMPAFFCARAMAGKNGQRITPDGLQENGWGWTPADIFVAAYMTNAHAGGANYGFLDGHSKWYKPAGNGFYLAIDGIDYDGNGSLGDAKIMR